MPIRHTPPVNQSPLVIPEGLDLSFAKRETKTKRYRHIKFMKWHTWIINHYHPYNLLNYINHE